MGNPYAPPRPGAQKPTDEARQPAPPPVHGPPGSPQGPQQGPPPGHGRTGGPAGPGAPQGPGGPGKPDPLAQVDPEQLRATTRQVLHFGLLMLVTLVTSSLAFPWRVVARSCSGSTCASGSGLPGPPGPCGAPAGPPARP